MAATLLALRGVTVTAPRRIKLERWALRGANDNRDATREELRINIMLAWWEDELASLYRNRRPTAKWRAAFREALRMVSELRQTFAQAALLADARERA